MALLNMDHEISLSRIKRDFYFETGLRITFCHGIRDEKQTLYSLLKELHKEKNNYIRGAMGWYEVHYVRDYDGCLHVSIFKDVIYGN